MIWGSLAGQSNRLSFGPVIVLTIYNLYKHGLEKKHAARNSPHHQDPGRSRENVKQRTKILWQCRSQTWRFYLILVFHKQLVKQDTSACTIKHSPNVGPCYADNRNHVRMLSMVLIQSASPQWPRYIQIGTRSLVGVKVGDCLFREILGTLSLYLYSLVPRIVYKFINFKSQSIMDAKRNGLEERYAQNIPKQIHTTKRIDEI